MNEALTYQIQKTLSHFLAFAQNALLPPLPKICPCLHQDLGSRLPPLWHRSSPHIFSSLTTPCTNSHHSSAIQQHHFEPLKGSAPYWLGRCISQEKLHYASFKLSPKSLYLNLKLDRSLFLAHALCPIHDLQELCSTQLLRDPS